MTPLLLLLGVVTLLFGIVPLVLSLRFGRYVAQRLREPLREYTPKASVIVPCKGTDLEFEENVQSVLGQDYPDFEVLFVTATEDDPAHEALRQILASRARSNERLLVAGIKPQRGQKLTNQLEALKGAAEDSEIYVFLDADIRLKENFLRHLVAPLEQPSVGATTGFPWYLPIHARMGSVLRSIWGGGALPLLIDKRHNFAAGAANAVKRRTFEQTGVAQAMDRSISDTFAITNSVKRAGLTIEFVPRCLFITPDDSTIGETIGWTNRQTIISRVYNPKFWWTVALTYSFANALLLLGVSLFVAAISTKDLSLLVPAVLMLLLIPLNALNAAIVIPTVERMIPEYKDQIHGLRWKYYLAAPLTALLIMLNSARSITTNEITWRGVRYRLVSPTETVVLGAG